VVGKLGDVEKVVGDAAYQRAGAVLVEEGEGQLLDVFKHVPPHVSLHIYAHFVPNHRDDIVQHRSQYIRQHHNGHNSKERAVHALGQILFHGQPGNVREGQVDGRGCYRAGHVDGEQLPVRPEVGKEYRQF